MTTTDMDRHQLAERTVRVLAGVVQHEPQTLHQDTRLFADLGMDSTNALELLMMLEDEFGFEFDPETLESRHLETVGSLTDYIIEQAGG